MQKKGLVPSETIIIKSFTFLLVGVILYLAFHIMRPFIGILAGAAVFAVFLNPLFLWITGKTGKNTLSGFLTLLFFILFIAVPLIILITNLIGETVSVTRQIQNDPEWLNAFQADLKYHLDNLRIPFELSNLNINGQISQFLSFLASRLGGFALGSVNILLDLFFTLLTLYFLLVNQSKIKTYIYGLNIFHRRYLVLLTDRATEIINGTVRGYLIVIILQLIVGVVGFLLFNIPAAFLLGSSYGLSSLLPVVGGLLVWVPVSVWQLTQGNISTAVLIASWFIGLSFLIENILAPKIIGQSTKLHQLIVMFSVFGGIQYFGLIGLVLGPVVIALAFIAFEIIKELSHHEFNRHNEIT